MKFIKSILLFNYLIFSFLSYLDFVTSCKFIRLNQLPSMLFKYFHFFIYFLKALSKGESVKLACFIILPRSGGNISSLVRHSYLSILSDNHYDNFDVSLAISFVFLNI